MSNQPLPLTDEELAQISAKVRTAMNKEFGQLKVNIWFMANDPKILYSFVKNTFDQVRIKLLENT